jgi:molybdenum cofactor biosynthesis enzyme MoaA
MTVTHRLRSALAPSLKQHPVVWKGIVAADRRLQTLRHSVANVLPAAIWPSPRKIEVAITAYCNLRCVGCRYGRDFMRGSQLTLPIVLDLLEDAKRAGIWDVRFYGGEPLLHPDLPAMVERARDLELQTHLTTNGILLRHKIDDLYAAGLRTITLGYYGTGAKYDGYVQRQQRFGELEAGVAAVRDRYGMAVRLRINWLLMRPSCNLDDLHAAIRFAERYAMDVQVDLVHYSLPYFTEGPDRQLQFRPEDRLAIESIVRELIKLKRARPTMFNQTETGLRSIPDWLIKGPDMKVPCDAYQMLWAGADGTVQLCYVTFPLGNLHQTRLSAMLFTEQHRKAARASFELQCPNCHCHYDRRIAKHVPSARRYGRLLAEEHGRVGMASSPDSAG